MPALCRSPSTRPCAAGPCHAAPPSLCRICPACAGDLWVLHGIRLPHRSGSKSSRGREPEDAETPRGPWQMSALGGGGWRQGGEMRGGVGLFGGKRRSVGQCCLIAFQSCPPPLGFGWGRAPCGLPGGPGTAENGVETLSPSPYKQGPFTIYQGCAIFQPKYIPLLLPAASVWAQRSPDEDREPRSASPCPVACLAPQQLLSWPQARSPVVENLP